MATKLISTERLIDDAIDGLFDYEPVRAARLPYIEALLGPEAATDRLTLRQKRTILDRMLADGVISLTVEDSEENLLDPGENDVPLIDEDLLDRFLSDAQAVALIESQFSGTSIDGERLLEMPRGRQRDTVSAVLKAIGWDVQAQAPVARGDRE